MEKLKNKHNHALTNWLKVIIFALLMLAPFFSVASKCLYVACNKNAKDSYSGENTYQINYKYQSNEVNSNNDLVVGNIYKFKLFEFYDDLGSDNYFRVNDTFGFIFIDSEVLNTNSINYYSTSYISINTFDGGLLIDNDNFGSPIIDIEVSENPSNPINFGNITLIFKYSNNIESSSDSYWSYIEYTDYNEIESVNIDNTGTLDNAFEYGVDQLTKTPTFAWTKNTAIYTPINAMTEGLGYTPENNVIAVLLTYWSLLTAIYVLFDIIISLFVKITHLLS